jgi:VanZ family protein
MGLDRGFAASTIGAMLLVVCWTAVIVVLSSLPHLDDDPGGHRFTIGIFVVGHAVFFTTLGFLTANLLAGSTHRLIWWTFVLATTFAVIDELHQAFVPGRDPSAVDLAFDAMGALLGATIFLSAVLWRHAANRDLPQPREAERTQLPGDPLRHPARPDATGK